MSEIIGFFIGIVVGWFLYESAHDEQFGIIKKKTSKTPKRFSVEYEPDHWERSAYKVVDKQRYGLPVCSLPTYEEAIIKMEELEIEAEQVKQTMKELNK